MLSKTIIKIITLESTLAHSSMWATVEIFYNTIFGYGSKCRHLSINKTNKGQSHISHKPFLDICYPTCTNVTWAFVPWMVYGPLYPGWYMGPCTLDGIWAFIPWMVYGPLYTGWYMGLCPLDGIWALVPWMTHGPLYPGWYMGLCTLDGIWAFVP